MSLRDKFQLKNDIIYLNHASTGVLPKSSIKKMKDVIKDFAESGYPGKEYQDRILTQARERIARLINGKAENIAFTLNTSQAIYIALKNITLYKGDCVIVMSECFPAAKYIADYNIPDIEVKYISFSRKDPVKVVKNIINRKVRVVILDHIQYFTGERIPIHSLSNFLKEKGIYLIVDGIQAVGSINVDTKKEGIDILACGGSKWLNGPQGTGFLFISGEAFINLNKTHTGWLGAPWKDYLNFNKLPEPFNDVRRFELGTRNIIGIAGLSESVKELLKYGIVKIEEKIKSLNSILLKGLKNENFEILTPEDRIAGIITGRPKSNSSFDVFNKLKENNIIISLRNDALRFSPHFYNTSEEIERVLEII